MFTFVNTLKDPPLITTSRFILEVKVFGAVQSMTRIYLRCSPNTQHTPWLKTRRFKVRKSAKVFLELRSSASFIKVRCAAVSFSDKSHSRECGYQNADNYSKWTGRFFLVWRCGMLFCISFCDVKVEAWFALRIKNSDRLSQNISIPFYCATVCKRRHVLILLS